MSTITPQRLAIYYSYPSLVSGSMGSISAAVDVFKRYNMVVLGSGLEQPSHPDNANTALIIQDPLSAGTRFYGYIDSTLAIDDIQTKIDLWKNIGARGIFLDQFGYDYGLTRQKQREMVWSVHAAGLRAFVNAWNPDDVFSAAVGPSNPTGLATRLGANDDYLAESFAVVYGSYDDADSNSDGVKDFQDKAVKMVGYRTTFGTKMAAIATLGSATFSQALADYSYYSAAAYGLDVWGFGEEFYSAVSADLPFRTRKSITGTYFNTPITTVGGVIEHQTNVGIHIDTNTHTVSNLLN